jgi:exonuclease VII small subunit
MRQLNKGEVELDEVNKVYQNASWRTPPKNKSPKKCSKPANLPSKLASGKKLDAALNQYKEAENSGMFRKEHLENMLLQYSEDVSKELVSSCITASAKSKTKKARFEVLVQYTYSKGEEEKKQNLLQRSLKTKGRISRTQRRRIQSSTSLRTVVMMTSS